MKMLLLSLIFLLSCQPAFCQRLMVGSPINLCSLATRQFLSGKEEESLALYQKAITKSENEYGKNSRQVATLNYELGSKALALSKFNLAEYCFKKAVEINPNCEAAQLMLIQLLRFRNKDEEAYYHTELALKKHADSIGLRRNLVLALQERNPTMATKQALVVSCLQNGTIVGAPPLQPKQTEKQTDQNPEEQNHSNKKTEEKKSDQELLINKNAKKDIKAKTNDGKKKTKTNEVKEKPKTATTAENSSAKSGDKTSATAVYQPINLNVPTKNPPTQITHKANKKPKISRTASRHNSSAMPAGLVPPPPPGTIVGFPVELKAKAGSIKLGKPIKAKAAPKAEESTEPTPSPEEKPKHASEHADEDPDFLIEWASVKKKHPK